MDEYIRAEDLRKVYVMGTVEVRAIDGVSFSVGKGQFMGIMGSSGSGKSTLLHMLGLLDPPTEGTLIIAGSDISSLSEAEMGGMFRLSRFGFIFQDYALVPELTAEENVSLVAMAQGGEETEAYTPQQAPSQSGRPGGPDGASPVRTLRGGNSSGWQSHGHSSTPRRSFLQTNPVPIWTAPIRGRCSISSGRLTSG